MRVFQCSRDDRSYPGGNCPDTGGCAAADISKAKVAREFGISRQTLYQYLHVARLDPESGELLQSIKTPGVLQVPSVAFGGENLDELYITTSRENCSEADMARYPNSGAIFMVKPGVKGIPPGKFGV